MASNSFGTLFRITTWGESHGRAIGVVIDGCPAGLDIREDEINAALALRAPGRNAFTSPRRETDEAQIASGVFEGKTTGAPISILVPNHDTDSSKYEPVKDRLKPGHAQYTYLEKYGVFDHRGSGRASGRETACRVAAGAVAKALLRTAGIHVVAYIKQIAHILANVDANDLVHTHARTYEDPVFCPDQIASLQIRTAIEEAKANGNSLGGIVEFIANPLPTGLGDPIYEKLEAKLAHAMMSLPASKGFEIGSGFLSVDMRGSSHNDRFQNEGGNVRTATNYAGGILGGISTGMPLIGRVAFKPTSSIGIPQESLTTSKESCTFELPVGSRHDPCVAIRAVPVVEAMVALVLADAMLLNRCARL